MSHPKIAPVSAGFYSVDELADDSKALVTRWRFAMFGEGCYVDEARGEVAEVIGRIQQSAWEDEASVRLSIYHRGLNTTPETRNSQKDAYRIATEEALAWKMWRLKNNDGYGKLEKM